MRLFVALELPFEVAAVLERVAERLGRQAGAARLVPRENLHLTLAFIGETRQVDEARAVFERTARREFVEPLELVLSGIGTFKGRSQGAGRGAGGGSGRGSGRGGKGSAGGSVGKGSATHTWWVGVEGSPALAPLADAFAEAYRAEGFAIERRAFKPHITLARGVRTERPIELSLPRLTMTADRLSLMKSDLSGPRPAYTPLLTWPPDCTFPSTSTSTA